jgi:hypothetical protein
LTHRKFLPHVGHTKELGMEIYTHFFGQKRKYHTVSHGEL